MPPQPKSHSVASFVESLSAVEGVRVTQGADLSRYNTFRIGGPAEYLVDLSDEKALQAALRAVAERGIPFFLLGLGSNVLLPDEGLVGVVVRLLGSFRRTQFQDTTVIAGGAVVLSRLVRECVGRGLLGLEALGGFPSTVGGAVRMNAGCYGREISDVLRETRLIDRHGEIETVPVGRLEAGYRSTKLQQTGQIVVEAVFDLHGGDPEEARERMAEVEAKRRASLPAGGPNVGSIFRNPPGDFAGRLIEACGLKGRRSGGAVISPRHANVIVNDGGATASDVLGLMLIAYHAVLRRFDIAMEPEVVLAGPLRNLWLDGTGRTRCTVEKSTAGDSSGG